MTFLRYLFWFLLLLLQAQTMAQTPWVNAIPTLYHPSFAGSSGNLRIASNDGLKVQNFPYFKLVTSQNYLYADDFISKIHTGVSVGLRYSSSSNNIYHGVRSNFFEGNLIIAPKFSIKEKHTISPSVQFTMGNYGSQYYYESNLYGGSSGLSTTPYKFRSNSVLLKVGLMYNSRKSFVGLSYQPTDYFLNYPLGFFQRFGFISGYTFRKSETSAFSFTPVLLLGGIQPLWNEFLIPQYTSNLYLNFKYKKAIAGLDVYTNLMLGYEGKKIRVMVVQRYGLVKNSNTLIFEQGYSAQLSLRYSFVK